LVTFFDKKKSNTESSLKEQAITGKRKFEMHPSHYQETQLYHLFVFSGKNTGEPSARAM
jgi:hypothetical protein